MHDIASNSKLNKYMYPSPKKVRKVPLLASFDPKLTKNNLFYISH